MLRSQRAPPKKQKTTTTTTKSTTKRQVKKLSTKKRQQQHPTTSLQTTTKASISTTPTTPFHNSLLKSTPQLNNNINNAFTKSPFTRQKRHNYSFMNISGPKDDRYLESGEVWIPPKAQIFDNTLIFSSIILERPPICLRDLPEWEKDWYQYRQSKLSEKAWVLPKDLEKNMLGKYGIEPEDFPDALPHITADDKADNRRSLYRKLEDPLYLICKVEQDFDEALPKEIWMFPTTQVREGENVRSAAERTLFYHAGDLEYYTMGNAPILYHPVRHSNLLKKEYPAAKQVKNFYMHSAYLGGHIELEPGGEITDYAWVTQGELSEYFDNDHCRDLLKLTGSSLYYLHAE